MAKRVPRLRIIDPTSAASSGGLKISVQGLWFKGPPQVMTVQMHIPSVGKTIDISCEYITETQLAFTVPDLTPLVKTTIAQAYVSIYKDDTDTKSESPASLILFPPLTSKKALPMHLPLSATSHAKISLFLNLRHSAAYICSRPATTSPVDPDTPHLMQLPIFARVSYVSEITKTQVQAVRNATWSDASVQNGELMVEFAPPKAAVGIMQVELSLNKVEYFGTLGYTVLRDFTLSSVRPRCLMINSIKNTEMILKGEYFLETGEIIIQIQQSPPGEPWKPPMPLLNINGIRKSPTEITGGIPPKTRQGLSYFLVSCNHGEHFCPDVVQGLLYRERIPLALIPTEGSLAGGTSIKILLPELEDDHTDSFQLLRSALKLTKVIRVKFQPEGDAPPQIVYGEPDMDVPATILCTAPTFEVPSEAKHNLLHCVVSISLDGKHFCGNLRYTYFGRFIVRSLSMHHGPNTGGTHLQIQMNHPVPDSLPIAVKFTSKSTHSFVSVQGHISPHDATFIECLTPPWSSIESLQLTKVQVSLNQGVNYIPLDEPVSNEVKFRNALDVDDSYLLFLFYTPPQITYIWPTSTAKDGGGLLRLKGQHVIDHGAIVSVVFSTSNMHRKVRGFIELDPTRHSDAFGDSLTLMCCAPPFEIGLCDVFVSLNDQQYTKCDFKNIFVPTRTQFIFFKAPCIASISPISSPSQVPTTLVIKGDQFIDTGSIQVRFTLAKDERDSRQVIQFAEGKLNAEGCIVCQTPILKVVQQVAYSRLDVSLNSCEYTDVGVPFFFYRQHRITQVDPVGMSLELPTQLRVFLQPEIVSDHIKIRLKVIYKDMKGNENQANLGPVSATSWSSSAIDWHCPALSSVVECTSQLIQVQIELAVNGQHYLEVGNLLQFCTPYRFPKVHRIWPVNAPFDEETEMHIFGDGFDNRNEILIRATIPGYTSSVQVSRTLIATFISPEQITIICPKACDFTPPIEQSDNQAMIKRASSRRRVAVGGWKVLPISLELSILHRQFSPMPFGSQFYFAPTIHSVTPLAGFTTGGTVMSLTLDPMQVHYMTIVKDGIPLRFGSATVCGTRDDNVISCTVPELPQGHHQISLALNQQEFQVVKQNGFPIYFEAFEPPQVHNHQVNSLPIANFGPIEGGTPVRVHGDGFVSTGVTLVKFLFPSGIEHTVTGDFVDSTLIECVSPKVKLLGFASIQVSCNGQQFSHHEGLCFEYHTPTQLLMDPSGAKCGSIHGGTPISFQILGGLPVDLSHLDCVIKVVDNLQPSRIQLTNAEFDVENRTMHFESPRWEVPGRVNLHVSLNNGIFFIDSGVTFLYYEPPQPIVEIKPRAGPITGQTEVTVVCPNAIDTGDIWLKFTNSTEPPKCFKASFDSHGKLIFKTLPVTTCNLYFVQLSLNGLDYTPVRPEMDFQYYTPPLLYTMSPGWGPVDAETVVTLHGDFIQDYGAPIHVKITPWNGKNCVVVDGRVKKNENEIFAIECTVPQGTEVGYCRVEFSLNGQQFTTSEYPDPRHVSPVALHKFKPLFPYRCFVPPFYLATIYGSASGGSRVLLCGSGKMIKLMTRGDYKCHVQFTPIKLLGHPSPSTKLPESIMVSTEIDLNHGTVGCRAPTFRYPCTATIELIFGDTRNVDTNLVHVAKEKFQFFDPPNILDVQPSCGPLTGSTVLVVHGSHFMDTGQVHIRFASAANKHEYCIVSGRVSHAFPNGSPSKNPLILCHTPKVECVSALNNTATNSNQQRSPTRMRRMSRQATNKHALMIQKALKEVAAKQAHQRQVPPSNTIMIDVSSLGNNDSEHPYLDVMVDFSLNGGEQFLSRSIPYRYYTPLNCASLSFGPQHVPLKNLDTAVSLQQPHRLRRLVVSGFHSPILYESKCIGIKFESVSDNAHSMILPCSPMSGSVVCDLPDFTTEGHYRVLFALNSQEFTPLHGVLHAHAPLHLSRITPQQFPYHGGHHVNASVALSSVASTLKQTTETFGFSRYRLRANQVEPSTTGRPLPPSWRPRCKHIFHIHFIEERPPKVPVTITIRVLETGWILAQVVVDSDSDVCEIDATDWLPGQVLLSAHVNESFNSYKCVLDSLDHPTTITFVKKPPPGQHFVGVGKMQLVQLSGEPVCEISNDSFDVSLLKDEWYGIEILSHSTGEEFILLNSDQIIFQNRLPADRETGARWIVGLISFKGKGRYIEIHQNYTSSNFKLEIPNEMNWMEIRDIYHVRQDPMWTLGDESIVYMNIYVKSGSNVLKITPTQTRVNENNQQIQLDFKMPSFHQPGPVLAWVAVNDICFSNSIVLNSYDPTTWKIQVAQPPCGLHGKSTPLKLRGHGFVETNTIHVRFATPTQVIDVPGRIRLRQFFNVNVVGFSVAGRTYSENNLVFSLTVQFNDENPIQTACRRMLYHLKKDMGTLLWNESIQFEVLEPHKTLAFTLRTTSDMGEIEEGIKLRNKNFKIVATGQWEVPELETGKPFRHVIKLDNVDHNVLLKREVEIHVCLDPPLLDTEMIVTRTPTLPEASTLTVQVSSGQYFVPPDNSVLFHVYELPKITQLKPPFLPYTTGGPVMIRGHGFFNSGLVMLKMAFLPPSFDYNHGEDEQQLQSRLDNLNIDEDKMVELPVTYISTMELRCDVPARLPSKNLVFCVSFDHHTFTPLTSYSLFRMYDIDGVSPSGGPTQGHSYIALRGTNLQLCKQSDTIPQVRFSWHRNGKLIERTPLLGELNSGILYCYTPTCRLGLDKLHVTLEVSLAGPDTPFSNDAVPFVYYKIPVLRNITPKSNLVPGASDVVVHTMESWENTSFLAIQERKCRFRMKGQVQVTSTIDWGAGLIRCRLPRFTVPIASPQLLPGAIKDDPKVQKLWVRNSGLFVTVLQARNLKHSNNSQTTNSTICPVVLLTLQDQRQRTSTKEYSTSPIYNEQFDFDLGEGDDRDFGDLIITVEHEVKSLRNDVIGTLKFPLKDVNHTVLLRAWFPLSSPQSTLTTPIPQRTARQLIMEIADKDRGTSPQPVSRGELELFIHFEPMVLKREPSVRESSIRDKLRSVMKKTMHAESIAKRIISRPDGARGSVILDENIMKAPPIVPRLLRQIRFVIPNEFIVELALNGQDFLSQCPISYLTQPLPIIENISPKCIPSRGGSKLSINGHNFVDTKCIRVAFLWGVEHYAALKQSFRVEAEVYATVPVTIVDAKYESTALLTCITPPTKFPPKPCFTLLVALNGMDFNSIFLPPIHDSASSSDDVWSSVQVTELVSMPELPQHEFKIYETPVVHSIQSANPIYTTKLIFRGENFGSADNPKALFIHVITKENEAKCPDTLSTLSIMSSMQLECWAPDFPPGSMTQIKIAMNGHDFIEMPELMRICNAPKLTKLDPSWVFSTGNHPLTIYGHNFVDTGYITVSFLPDNTSTPTIVQGTCENGRIHCRVPTVNHIDFEEVSCSSIQVDVSLGLNKLAEFTGIPLSLQLYHNVPHLQQVSPSDGPIWGGTKMTLRGENFVDTATLFVRFTRLHYGLCPKTQVQKWHMDSSDDHIAIVKAKYESAQLLTCMTPPVSDEGYTSAYILPDIATRPVAIQLSLNGRDYSAVHDATWFVAWRTWQTRVNLLRQSMHQDGGARLAWQKYFEMKSAPKLNFYGGRLKTTSWKILGAHQAKANLAPPKRVENLPEIMREMLVHSQPKDVKGEVDDEMQETEFYIPPNTVWPDTNDFNNDLTLVERLRSLYRNQDTQQDIYSRLIFMYDNAVQLNAKYTNTTIMDSTKPNTATEGSQRGRGTPFLRKAALSAIDLKKIHRRTGLCFHGLCEGIRWIFPKATEADLVELWVFLDPQKNGVVSLDTFCSQLLVDTRPPSPEPGPMHYNPHQLESHIPTPSMLEPPTSPRPITPQPFLEVGAIIDVLQPQSPRVVISTRENYKAQWCDPLYKGPGSEIAKSDVNLDNNRKILSTSPRIHEPFFPPLTKEEKQIHETKLKPTPPPASYGILSLKFKPISRKEPSTKLRRGTIVSSLDGKMLQRRSSTVFSNTTQVIRKPSRAVGFSRKHAIGSLTQNKQYKDVKPVYLDILASRPVHETAIKSDIV